MYKHIVVGIDGSDLATLALRHALVLGQETGARLTVVTSTEPTVLAAGAEFMAAEAIAMIPELEEAKARSAEATLTAATALATAEGQTIKTLHMSSTTPADAIVGTARQVGADLIVMGSHGRRGLGRLLLGSQAAEVLARSTIPVLVVK